MAITFATPDNTTSKGAAASGNITLVAPTSPQTNDIWIAVIHSSDQVSHTFTDWTQIQQGNGGGTTSRLSVWYHRYAGVTPNLIVSHTAGQSPIGGIVSFRGVKTTGSPVNVSSTITGGTDASIEHTAVVPTVAGCCLLVINGAADDNNRTALGGDYAIGFEDSAGGTQNSYNTALGTPDGSVSVFYDLSVPASTTGTITVTQAAADPWAACLVALEPASLDAITSIIGEGSLNPLAFRSIPQSVLIENRGVLSLSEVKLLISSTSVYSVGLMTDAVISREIGVFTNIGATGHLESQNVLTIGISTEIVNVGRLVSELTVSAGGPGTPPTLVYIIISNGILTPVVARYV